MGQESTRTGGAWPRLSVVVPAFNEAPSLYANLGRLRSHLAGAPFTSELVVIDDGSSDETAAEANRFAADHDGVTVVIHPHNLGLGQAIKSGFRAARGDILVTFDADLSYSPDHIDRMVSTMVATGASVVVASPYMAGGSVTGVPPMRALLSRWANKILRRLSLHHISTVTGMVRAYDREFVDGLSLKAMDNQINAEIIYKATLLRREIIEIPGNLVWTRDEVETKRRSGNLRFVTMIVDSLFSGFIFRPFTFFMLPGAIVMVLSLYALGWSAYHLLRFLPDQSGSLDAIISGAAAAAFAYSPHSFVIGGIGLVVAFQLISIGIISAQNKRYFEEIWFQGDLMSRRWQQRAARDGALAELDDQARDATA